MDALEPACDSTPLSVGRYAGQCTEDNAGDEVVGSPGSPLGGCPSVHELIHAIYIGGTTSSRMSPRAVKFVVFRCLGGRNRPQSLVVKAPAQASPTAPRAPWIRRARVF